MQPSRLFKITNLNKIDWGLTQNYYCWSLFDSAATVLVTPKATSPFLALLLILLRAKYQERKGMSRKAEEEQEERGWCVRDDSAAKMGSGTFSFLFNLDLISHPERVALQRHESAPKVDDSPRVYRP
jgi:hypothetical protein